MLSLVTAAEMQYRHDADSRAVEMAHLQSIRERHASIASESERLRMRVATPRRTPAVWARPIGLHAAAC